jgi:hypothetical protein
VRNPIMECTLPIVRFEVAMGVCGCKFPSKSFNYPTWIIRKLKN